MITVEHAASCVQISFQNGALFLFAQQAANYLGSEWMRPPVDHDLRKDWRHPAIATILKVLKDIMISWQLIVVKKVIPMVLLNLFIFSFDLLKNEGLW